MAIDNNWIDSMNKWIAQRECSIVDSNLVIEHNAKMIANLQRQSCLCKEQIELDKAMIEHQKNVIELHIVANK